MGCCCCKKTKKEDDKNVCKCTPENNCGCFDKDGVHHPEICTCTKKD